MPTLQGERGGYRKTPMHVYFWRFCAGQHMSGARHTNATFKYRATRDLTDHQRASRWAHLPGYRRALWRISAVVVTLAILYGMITAQTLTIDSTLGALSALTLAGVIRTRYLIRRARHHKHVIRPLYETTTLITGTNTIHGHAHGDNHKRYLTIPRNYRNDPKARIRLAVPATWEARPPEVKRLTDLFNRKLGGQWDIVMHLADASPFVEFIPSPSPPNALTFADMRKILDAGNQNRLILGKGTHDKIIDIDLDSESPHVAISMGTGGGKSSLLRLIVAYLIHHGVERVDIIDPKRVSHNWAKGIPGVFIHRTMAEQMAALAAFRKRMELRYEELDTDDTREFPRHVMVIEEQNSWMDYAKTYWEDYRAELDSAERGKTPRRNPAIGDLAYCLFQGRQARMNVFSVFQSMSASAAGGRDSRENYGAKILARYSAQTWKMLVGTTPVPRSSRINGRGRYALGDSDAEVQFAFLTTDEAIAYALAGVPRPIGADLLLGARPESTDPLMTVPAGPATGSDDAGPPMSLREMCDAGLVPVRYSAATRARTRAGDAFPRGHKTPVGTLYDPSDVRAFFGSRGRKHAASN